MKTKLLVLAIAIALASSILVACDNNPVTSDASNSASTEQASQNSNKSNVDLFLDFLLSIHKEATFGAGRSGQGHFMGIMEQRESQQNIVNPITKGTEIYSRPDHKHNLDDSFRKFGSSTSAVLIAISMDKLKNINTDEIAYGCNEDNKGTVIAIGCGDGFYLYQIDENGNKTNEKIHYFPEKEE